MSRGCDSCYIALWNGTDHTQLFWQHAENHELWSSTIIQYEWGDRKYANSKDYFLKPYRTRILRGIIRQLKENMATYCKLRAILIKENADELP